MAKLLIVDDDRNICGILQDILQTKGYTVDTANDVQDARQFIEIYSYDVIILDWNLGSDDGATFLRGLRSNGMSTPVLMLTARNDEQSCIFGLEHAGADDYLTKPFSPPELLARITALSRRPSKYYVDDLIVGGLKLTISSKEATFMDKSVQLHNLESAILAFLMKHPQELFTAEALLTRLWSSEAAVSLDTVRVHISNLRSRLRSIDAQHFLKTVHSMGYKFDAPRPSSSPTAPDKVHAKDNV